MTVAIIILGHINNKKGELSTIAQSRCDKAFEEFNQLRCAKILCTGGFGRRFNVTDNSHAYHLQRYLMNKGIAGSAFLTNALSTYTFEDALLAKPVIEASAIKEAILVTSEFHMPRAKMVFDYVMPNIAWSYAQAQSLIDKQELEELIKHEAFAIKRDKNCCIT